MRHMRTDSEPAPKGWAALACGSKESEPPYPVSPEGKAGAGGCPPSRRHATRQQKALARIDAASSPTRGLPPPCVSPAASATLTTKCGSSDISKLDRTVDAKKRLHKVLDTTNPLRRRIGVMYIIVMYRYAERQFCKKSTLKNPRHLPFRQDRHLRSRPGTFAICRQQGGRSAPTGVVDGHTESRRL